MLFRSQTGRVPTPFRPANCQFDDRWSVPTLADVIQLAQAAGVGIYPETKHPTHILKETGIDINAVLLDTLGLHGIKNFDDLPVYIQSFEVENLQRLRREMQKRDMDLRLVQLLADGGQPFDIAQAGGSTTRSALQVPRRHQHAATLRADQVARPDCRCSFV